MSRERFYVITDPFSMAGSEKVLQIMIGIKDGKCRRIWEREYDYGDHKKPVADGYIEVDADGSPLPRKSVWRMLLGSLRRLRERLR